jgi:Flp pilus assembly protein TadD
MPRRALGCGRSLPPLHFSPPAPSAAAALDERGPVGAQRPRLLEFALLLAASLAAYVRVFSAGFIWDDAAHVTAPALRSWAGLGRIWTEPGATQQYYPLLHSVFWLEHHLWGETALGYHLANLGFHVLVAALVGLILRRLQVPGASLAALLFALHPVQVESVAWISEQKNTLSTVLYLASAWFYLGYDVRRQRRFYFAALACFILALLTKSVTATLPATLLLIFWWRRGRLEWRRDVVPLLGWFVLGAGAGLFTAWMERHVIGAGGAAFDLTVAQRLLLAGRALCFYGGKLLWPQPLAFNYPRWALHPDRFVEWLPVAAVLVLTGALWRWRHRSRAPLTAWLFFAGTLFPVLGFFNVYPFQYSYVADHFQYVACLGPLALFGAVVGTATSARAPVCALGLSVALGSLAGQQVALYRDAESLYRGTLARNPESWLTCNNLGELLLKQPATRPEAIVYLERALRLHPDYPEAHNNLGLALAQGGRTDEAIAHLSRAVQLKPTMAEAYNNLGISLARAGRAAEAVGEFRHAAALAPARPNIEENWAKALLLLGRKREADEHFAVAARLRALATP